MRFSDMGIFTFASRPQPKGGGEEVANCLLMTAQRTQTKKKKKQPNKKKKKKTVNYWEKGVRFIDILEEPQDTVLCSPTRWMWWGGGGGWGVGGGGWTPSLPEETFWGVVLFEG